MPQPSNSGWPDVGASRAAPAVSRPAFRGGQVHVRVPATSANLGPGYDAFGLALALHDDVVARIGDDGVLVDVAGEGAGDVPRDESHLVVHAMRTTFDRLGGQPRGIEIAAANRIPHERGLGSSAAAIVAGVLLARALALGGERVLPDAEALALASELEGHPDNVAACLLGGFTVAWTGDRGAAAVRVECDPSIRPVLLIPPLGASTVAARDRLPVRVSHADAVFNASRAALLVAALTGAPDALLAATDDRLHQPYRATAMPQTAQLVAQLRAKAIPAVVSGAGPAVLALARTPREVGGAVALTPDGWRSEQLQVDLAGAHLVQPAR